jgi:hypothetical protein
MAFCGVGCCNQLHLPNLGGPGRMKVAPTGVALFLAEGDVGAVSLRQAAPAE